MDEPATYKQIMALKKFNVPNAEDYTKQDAIVKLGELFEKPEVVKMNGTNEPLKNGSKYDWEEKHCRAVALEHAIASTKDREADSVDNILALAHRFFHFIWKGE